MEKPTALIISDGSLESAVLCGIARQKHETVLLDVGDASDSHVREALTRQVEFLRPRQTHTPGPTGPLDDANALYALLSAIAAAAPVARRLGATIIYVPLRLGLSDAGFSKAAEFIQVAEELLRHGLELHEVKLSAPLLELERWQVVDLANQLGAPLTRWHGETDAGAFMQAGRAKP